MARATMPPLPQSAVKVTKHPFVKLASVPVPPPRTSAQKTSSAGMMARAAMSVFLRTAGPAMKYPFAKLASVPVLPARTSAPKTSSAG